MKLLTSIAFLSTASAFAPQLSNVRVSPVKPLQYGWDEYNKMMSQPAAPAAPPAPATPPPVAPPAAYSPPAPAAPVAPPAPAAPQADDQEPMSKAWAATVKYDPSKDIFPTFPPHYRTFDEIWAEFQAKKAAGQI